MEREVKDIVSGVKTLFGMPVCANIDELSADIAILGAPFDCGSSVGARAGTRFTPKAIREARNMFSVDLVLAGSETNLIGRL